MKVLENNKEYIIKALKAGAALFLYFVLSNLQALPFILLNIDTSTLSQTFRIFYSLFYELFLLMIILLLFLDDLKKAYSDLKKNHKKYFSSCFKYWIIGLLVMMFSNLILQKFSTNGIAGNEQTINELFEVSPLYIWVSAVLIAPFMEELLFRQGIRNIFKNDILFILISGILFGSLHVIGNVQNFWDFLYIIPYSSLGIAFAYMLYKTKNIFVTIGFHFMHNGILMALQFLILLIS